MRPVHVLRAGDASGRAACQVRTRLNSAIPPGSVPPGSVPPGSMAAEAGVPTSSTSVRSPSEGNGIGASIGASIGSEGGWGTGLEVHQRSAARYPPWRAPHTTKVQAAPCHRPPINMVRNRFT